MKLQSRFHSPGASHHLQAWWFRGGHESIYHKPVCQDLRSFLGSVLLPYGYT